MGALLSKLAKGPLYATPGYRPKLYRAPKSTFAAEFGTAYNAVNRPSLRLPAALSSGSLTPTGKVKTPAGPPQRWNLQIPLTSSPPTPVGVLPLPKVPGVSPSGTQNTQGDLLGSLGSVWGDITSGQEINLANFPIFLGERTIVAGATFGGIVSEAIADAFGMPKTGDQIAGAWKSAGDTISAPLRAAAGVAESILSTSSDSYRDAYLGNRADFSRALADPAMTLDAAVESAGDFHAKLMVRQMRLQGMSDKAIRTVLFDAVDLPTEVKSTIVRDPKMSVFDALSKSGLEPQFSYGDDLGSQAQNMVGPMAGLALDYLAGRGLVRGTKELAYGLVSAGGRGAGAAASLLGAGQAVAPVARVGVKAGKYAIVAGTGIYATTKVAQAVAKYAGNDTAYAFLNETLWNRPLSNDPATCFIGSLLFTGLEGAAFYRKLVPQGARIATSASVAAVRAPIVAGALVVGKKVPLVKGALATWEDVALDRLAYMYDPTDIARGRAYVEKYYVKPITDAAGHPMPGPLDHGMISDEVVQTAIDLLIERMPPELIASYSVMKDGIARTERFVKIHGDDIVRVIQKEPKELARRWRNESWNHRMGDLGVTFDGDAAGLIAVEYHRVKRLTYELRMGNDAVIGMVEHVTPDATKALREEVAAKFADATTVLPNGFLTDKLARMPGLRHGMGEVRSAASAEGRVINDGGWTRADFEKALDITDDRLMVARGLGKRDVASAVKYLPTDAPVSKIADVVGLDIPTVKVVLSDLTKPLAPRELTRVMDYLYAVAGKSRDDISRMSAEEVRQAAYEHLDDTLAPLYAAGERVAKVNDMARRLQGELVDARAMGDTARAATKQKELENLLALSDYALDPQGGTFAREALGAQKEERISTLLDGYETRAELVARIEEGIDELSDVEGELVRLGHGRSLADAFDDYGRYVGFDNPRLSERALSRIERELGIKLDYELNEAVVPTLRRKIRERGSTPQDRGKLIRIMGPSAYKKVFGPGSHHAGSLTLTELAAEVGMTYDDFVSAAMANLERRGTLLDRLGVASEAHALRILSWGDPKLPVRVARAFERRMEETGELAYDAAAGTNVRRLDPLVESDLAAFRDPQMPAIEKARIMRRWGFDPDRDYDLAVMGTSDAWALDDPVFRVEVHPRNVAALERVAGEWTTTPSESTVIKASEILDADHRLASAAATILRRAGRLSRQSTDELDDTGELMYARPGPIDWSRLTKDDLDEILAAEATPDAVRPITGELDALIDAADEEGLTKAVLERAQRRRESPPPATDVPEEIADRVRAAPRPARKSYIYGRELVRKGGKVTMRVDESIMADPKYARGAATLGTILWGSPKARPHTIEGVLEALRDIENGTARQLGIGEAYLADAQRTADALLGSAMRRIDSAGFVPGVFTRGIRYDDLALADRELWAELMGQHGLTITDPAAGLMYGLKKRPQPKWAVPEGEGAAPKLLRPGAAAMELEAVRAAAAESHVPGIVEELLTGKFSSYEERLAQSEVRKAFNLVFGDRPKSAYSTGPWEYVFGKIANRDIGAFVRDEFRTRVVAHGLTNDEVDVIWQKWHDLSRGSTGGSTKRRFSRSTEPFEVRPGDRPQYATINNIPNTMLDKAAREALAEYHAMKGTKTPGYAKLAPGPKDTSVPFAFLLRESASPVMRHLHDGLVMHRSLPVVGGKRVRLGTFGDVLETGYGQTFNSWRTTIYPIFRFAMDVRFAAMEFIEPYALGFGRGAMSEARYTSRGLMDMNKTYLAHGTAESRVGEGFATFGQGRRFEQAYSLFEKERTPAVEAEIARIRRESPEVYAAARKEALAQRTGIMAENPADFEAALRMMAEDDPALSDAIAAFDNGDTGAWLDELDRWHRKLTSSFDPEEAITDEIDRIIAQSPHLNEIASRVGEVNRKYWADVRDLFWGKAERSRAERVLNHPLLFWPISYQIRATEWMANLLFRRVGGLQTNALGAYELDKIMAAHNKAMETDPEYRSWLDRHRNVLFAASMLLPITPDQVGVSLAPWTRLAGDAVGLWEYDRSTSAFAIGPVYTITQLAPNVAGELWADVRSWEELRDTPGVSQAAKAATKMIGLPYGRDVEWDAEEPPPPPPWVASGP